MTNYKKIACREALEVWDEFEYEDAYTGDDLWEDAEESRDPATEITTEFVAGLKKPRP